MANCNKYVREKTDEINHISSCAYGKNNFTFINRRHRIYLCIFAQSFIQKLRERGPIRYVPV